MDKYAVRHVERLLARNPGLWCGIGELLLRHDDLTGLTVGETPRANHRALFPVYELAADRGLPVLVHHNVTSVSKSDHPIYLDEMEEAVREFPRTRFVFAHCGMSRRVNVPFYPQMVRRLLEQYPNLAVDRDAVGDVGQAGSALECDCGGRLVGADDVVAHLLRIAPACHDFHAHLLRVREVNSNVDTTAAAIDELLNVIAFEA